MHSSTEPAEHACGHAPPRTAPTHGWSMSSSRAPFPPHPQHPEAQPHLTPPATMRACWLAGPCARLSSVREAAVMLALQSLQAARSTRASAAPASNSRGRACLPSWASTLQGGRCLGWRGWVRADEGWSENVRGVRVRVRMYACARGILATTHEKDP